MHAGESPSRRASLRPSPQWRPPRRLIISASRARRSKARHCRTAFQRRRPDARRQTESQVAELLGHSGTAMLHKHYSHLGARSQALREALGKVRAG